MTPEEEDLFRGACRRALQKSDLVVMVLGDPPGTLDPFALVDFRPAGKDAMGIIIPAHWENQDGIQERCRAILRQESQALAGQALN